MNSYEACEHIKLWAPSPLTWSTRLAWCSPMLLIGFMSSNDECHTRLDSSLQMTKAPHAWITTCYSYSDKTTNECLVALGIRMILWKRVGLGPLHLRPSGPPTLDCSNTLCLTYLFLPFPSPREKEETEWGRRRDPSLSQCY